MAKYNLDYVDTSTSDWYSDSATKRNPIVTRTPRAVFTTDRRLLSESFSTALTFICPPLGIFVKSRFPERVAFDLPQLKEAFNNNDSRFDRGQLKDAITELEGHQPKPPV